MAPPSKVKVDLIVVVVRYNGHWEVQNGEDRYIAGEKKLLTISSNISYIEILHLLHLKLKIDSAKYVMMLHMLSDHVDSGHLVPIDDDDSLIAFCVFAKTNRQDVLTLYITLSENELQNHHAHDNHFEFDLNCIPDDDVHILPNDDAIEKDYSLKEEPENHESIAIKEEVTQLTQSVFSRRNDVIDHLFSTQSMRNDIGDHPFCSQGASSSNGIVPVGDVTTRTTSYHFGMPVIEDEDKHNIEIHHASYNGDTLTAMDIYPNKVSLQNVVGRVALLQGFQFHVKRSNKRVWEVKCVQESCHWRLRATNVTGSSLFQIRYVADSHTCARDQINPHHKQASKRNLGEMMRSAFLRSERNYTPKDIIDDVTRNLKIDISYSQAWRAKQHALHTIRGSPEESFSMLPQYCHQLRLKNPETVAEVETDEKGIFQSVYMSMGCCIFAFKKYLRHVICIDAAHLKGKYMGVIFIAVALDANNQIYPIAFGISASETYITWCSFLKRLRESVCDVNDLAIISDRAPSIISAVAFLFPGVPHGICCHHLKMNLKAKFKDISSIDVLFWQAAKATNITAFKLAMTNIRFVNEKIFKYLEEAGFEKWALCMFSGLRYGIMTTNCAESMNAVTRHARYLPVTMLLEYLRATMQKWFYERKKEADTFPLCLSRWATDELIKVVKDVASTMVCPISYTLFEVKIWDDTAIVDLEHSTCTCGSFQLLKIPCPHVAGVAKFLKLSDCNKFVDKVYTKENWRHVYSDGILPLGDHREWSLSDDIKVVLPPEMRRRRPGRPKKNARIRSSGEEIKAITCSRCNQNGHTRNNCKTDLLAFGNINK